MPSLTQKYRPQTLKEMAGNLQSRQLIHAIWKGDVKSRPHSFLLTGPAGCGKTTLARIAARMFGANSPQDILEYNNAAFRGIDLGREIIGTLAYMPSPGSTARAIILDEVHGLTKQAQESLLKAIEEPPEYCYFFLCTTDPQQLLPTTKSRCTAIQLGELTQNELGELLKRITAGEGRELPDEVYGKIIEASKCAPRLAVTMLETALAAKDPTTVTFVADVAEQDAYEICKAMLRPHGDGKAIAGMLDAYKKKGGDAEGLRRSILGLARVIALKSGFSNMRVYAVMKAFETPTYNNGFDQLVISTYEAIQNISTIGGE